MSERDRIPKWREDFPYESDNDEYITRRDATRFLLLVSGGLALGTGLVWVRARTPGQPPEPRVALGKAKPGSMNYGTTGVGAANHLVSELLCREAGLKMPRRCQQQ